MMKTRFTRYAHVLALLTIAAITAPNISQAHMADWSKFTRLAYNADHNRELAELYRQGIAQLMEQRTTARKTLPLSKYLLSDCEQFWADGVMVYSSFYNDEEQMVEIHKYNPSNYADTETDTEVGALKVSRRGVMPKGRPDCRVTVEELAGRVMLVVRDASGNPIKALYSITIDDIHSCQWGSEISYILMGNYTTPTGDNVVFGPKLEHYVGKQYHEDPGMLDAYQVDPDNHCILILYGDKRVSRGDPSRIDPNNRMPGEGGSGAIMGPSEWTLYPTADGFNAVVTHDEPFVDHLPRIGYEGDTASLTCIQSPFVGLDGKWAFASVIPLTHTFLQTFPREVLTLMRGEIYARYGDTFKDPDTQRYFDAQPWYKKSQNPIHLTDLERFNYQLIKQVEASK